LTVTHIWNIWPGRIVESWQEWGPLEADHLWHYDSRKMEKEEDEDDEVERGDFGEFAEDDSDSEPEDTKPSNRKATRRVTNLCDCAGCDREIEFGWSNPIAAAHIPVECSDFIPGNAGRNQVLGFWQQKHWLPTEKTSHDQRPDRCRLRLFNCNRSWQAPAEAAHFHMDSQRTHERTVPMDFKDYLVLQAR